MESKTVLLYVLRYTRLWPRYETRLRSHVNFPVLLSDIHEICIYQTQFLRKFSMPNFKMNRPLRSMPMHHDRKDRYDKADGLLPLFMWR